MARLLDRRGKNVEADSPTYTGSIGLVLTLLSVGGLMGVWNVALGRMPLLLGTAAICFCATLGPLGTNEIRVVIGALGVLYLLAGALPLALSVLEGVPLSGHEARIVLTRVLLGASSVVVWFFSRPKRSSAVT